MSHDHHPSLPGYAEGQLLVDGCTLCEARVRDPADALANLDDERQLAAWRLMRDVKWYGGKGAGRPVSDCEHALLRTLYAMAVYLERGGIGPDEVERRMEMRSLYLRRDMAGSMPELWDEERAARLAQLEAEPVSSEVVPRRSRVRDVRVVDLSAWTPGQVDALRTLVNAAKVTIRERGVLECLYDVVNGDPADRCAFDYPDDAALRALQAGSGLEDLVDALDRTDQDRRRLAYPGGEGQ